MIRTHSQRLVLLVLTLSSAQMATAVCVGANLEPPELAYGLTPPPSIPPTSMLIFDIEVLGLDSAGIPAAGSPTAAR
jgi:hypothetical protein